VGTSVAGEPNSNSKPRGWFKTIHSDWGFALCRLNPVAFMLLYLIARRTRFKPDLKVPAGWAIVDYKILGVTEQQFRTAKSQLAQLGYVEFKSSTKSGTTARLMDTRIFDPLNISRNGMATEFHAESQRNSPNFSTDKSTESSQGEKPIESSIFSALAVPSNGNNNGMPPIYQRDNLEKSTNEIECITKKGRRTAELLPPSLDEVLAAATAMGLPTIEANIFFEYYKANGWLVGKNPMKSWRAALSMWKYRWQKDPKNNRRQSGLEGTCL
jgi:hypothetical protein